MSTDEAAEEAVEVLQQLGLKQYEAECFVGLARLPSGTAKQLSEITDVPRTRVYDAVRVLEAQGLVEVQHSSPKQFRAVSLSEASETLRDQYEARVDRLAAALEQADSAEHDEEPVQEVWTLTGQEAIANRTISLVEGATNEVVLVIGDEALLTDDLFACLNGLDSEVDLLVGAVSEDLQDRIHEAVPGATTFLSGLNWLQSDGNSSDLAIGRLLLVDRSQMLVSTRDTDSGEEQAVFGGGFRNGLIVIARRLLSQGLVTERDPELSSEG